MRTWDALPEATIQARVFEALQQNRSYQRDHVLGLPGSFLDRKVFPPLPELAGMPLLQTWIENPNHIGCHTLGTSEPAFAGTHALEQEALAMVAEVLLRADPGSYDGYLASGGTESNLQALWTFRNALRHRGIPRDEIGLLASEDTHYSIYKGADLLDLPLLSVPVDPHTRRMTPDALAEAAAQARAQGLRWILVVLNMGTTLFGTVDDPEPVLAALDAAGLQSLVHVDAAFGGFIYPLTTPDQPLSFDHPRLVSFTLDAHKMLQAPYGTGIHLIRKGWIEHVLHTEASYVPGHDCTLIGSRSGANAVAVWMILRSWGHEGGVAFCRELLRRTQRLVEGLHARGIATVHEPGMNLVAMEASAVPDAVAERYQLVADDVAQPRWYKVVVMDHVLDEHIDELLAALDPS